jgi:hypothetical protein
MKLVNPTLSDRVAIVFVLNRLQIAKDRNPGHAVTHAHSTICEQMHIVITRREVIPALFPKTHK